MKKADSVEEKTQKRILDIIVGQDDISWKAIIFGLIATEQMDPWDINISLIAQKFLEELKKFQQMDFRIGGKVVLASAVLLKLKAERLRDEELTALDNLIKTAEEPVNLGLEELQSFEEPGLAGERPKLVPRTPQPRKRKVSVYDLVEALEMALEMDARRPPHVPPKFLDTIDPPEHHIDISFIIREVYDRIYGHYEVKRSQDKLMFHHITRSEDPRDKVMTFIPLLHLETARKVDMEQTEHFGPVAIRLLDKTPPAYEPPKEKEPEPEPEVIQGHVIKLVKGKKSAKKKKSAKQTKGKKARVMKKTHKTKVAKPKKAPKSKKKH